MVESMKNEHEMSDYESEMAEAIGETRVALDSLGERAEENAEKVVDFLSDILSDENAKEVLGRGFDSLLSEGKLSEQNVNVLKGKLQTISNNTNIVSRSGGNISVNKGNLRQWIKSNLNSGELENFQKLAEKTREQAPG